MFWSQFILTCINTPQNKYFFSLTFTVIACAQKEQDEVAPLITD